MISNRPHSFFHISKPEVDFPFGTNPYDAAVYIKGRKNLDQMIHKKALLQDALPGFYLYRQKMQNHSQLGLVALVSCEEYDRNIIKKHEQTRPEKVADRVKHIETLDAQTGPVFLIYHAHAELDSLFEKVLEQESDCDFTSQDEVQHTAWTLFEPELCKHIQSVFQKIPHLYLADGHHRSAAACQVAKKRNEEKHANFLAVIFPHNQMQILAYNRFVKDLNGMNVKTFLKRIEARFRVSPLSAPITPSHKNQVTMCIDRKWFSLNLPSLQNAKNLVASLDVSILQDQILRPLLGIDNPRTNDRIRFVGGNRGSAELERLTAAGGVAFWMHPTNMKDLMRVADADQMMPPKSTWFEPKLRDGMFTHLLR